MVTLGEAAKLFQCYRAGGHAFDPHGVCARCSARKNNLTPLQAAVQQPQSTERQ